MSSDGYFFLSIRTWFDNSNERKRINEKINKTSIIDKSCQPYEHSIRKSGDTLSIISGINFCPPNPGSTVITRTISTGFSASTCEKNKDYTRRKHPL